MVSMIGVIVGVVFRIVLFLLGKKADISVGCETTAASEGLDSGAKGVSFNLIVTNGGNVTARDVEINVGWGFARPAIRDDGSTIYVSKGDAALDKDQPDYQFLTMTPGQHHKLDIEHLQDQFPEKVLLADDALVISAVVSYRIRLLGIPWRRSDSFQYNLPDYLATDSSGLSN